MRRTIFFIVIAIAVTLFSSPAFAVKFDEELQNKADNYQEWLEEWHHTDLGALSAAVRFTDETYSEIDCYHALGDSMIWTGMYLGSQALRYMVTGDETAREEVLYVVNYMHTNMEMTDTPGYIGRYAGLDQMPYNCGYTDPANTWKVLGEGEWEGYFWVCQTSRDQYSGYMFGMTLAFQALEGDEETRDIIRGDLAAIVEMLENNYWNITDQNGQYTGNNAAWIGPLMRISWLVQAAYVLDTPYYWDLLDQQFEINKPFLAIDSNSFLNKYSEYFGNNLRHLAYYSIFRLWPDRERLEFLWDVWMKQNRPWTKDCNNPWFDAVHITGCQRLGICDENEYEAITEDAMHTLGLYWEVPDAKPEITCSEMELDPFSVFMDNILNQYPWLRELIDIKPQTKDAREFNDRHWTDMYWQSHGVFEATCYHPADPTYVGSGFDYLVAYYMGVFYGILPGDGPYGDDDPVDDDTVDDDTVDDDTSDDDAIDDDAIDDDVAPDDDATTDDDVVTDDDQTDDDSSNPVDDDDDDDDGCGC